MHQLGHANRRADTNEPAGLVRDVVTQCRAGLREAKVIPDRVLGCVEKQVTVDDRTGVVAFSPFVQPVPHQGVLDQVVAQRQLLGAVTQTGVVLVVPEAGIDDVLVHRTETVLPLESRMIAASDLWPMRNGAGEVIQDRGRSLRVIDALGFVVQDAQRSHRTR